MGTRRDKGLAVARYLTGASGIPGIRWTGHKALEAPYPYRLSLTTSGVTAHWTGDIAAIDPSGIGGAVKYGLGMPDIPSAYVGMRLDHFCSLIGLHYETNINGRGE